MHYDQVPEVLEAVWTDTRGTISCDNVCVQKIELGYTAGLPNCTCQVTFVRCKIEVEGKEPIYLPIEPYQAWVGFAEMRKLINAAADVGISSNFLSDLKRHEPSSEEFANGMNMLMEYSGLSRDAIQKKIDNLGGANAVAQGSEQEGGGGEHPRDGSVRTSPETGCGGCLKHGTEVGA